MKYVCDGPGRTAWFRIETAVEAEQESRLMDHAVEKYFREAREAVKKTFTPPSTVFFEQMIGLEDHIQREMPLFLTLRDREGEGLATAMLPPGGRDDPGLRIVIVGKSNANPYLKHRDAIDALGAHFGLDLAHERCYPYGR